MNAVQVNLEAVGDGVVVDAGGQPARLDQRVAVEPRAIGQRSKLARCLARLTSAAAADVNAQLGRPRIESALERAHDGRGDSGGMPVHAHHGAERLKPERIAQPGEERGSAVVKDHALGNRGAKRRHARREPVGHASAMQRKVGRA